jgi:hypothetical protein
MGRFSATLRVWNQANPDKAAEIHLEGLGLAADPVQKKLVPTIGLALSGGRSPKNFEQAVVKADG